MELARRLLERLFRTAPGVWPAFSGKFKKLEVKTTLELRADTGKNELRQTGAVRQSRRHLPTLDGWRTVALAMVLFCHTAAGFYTRADYFASSTPRYGGFALNIFFGLSGLLICKLFLEEFDKTGTINLPSFYLRRICRIILPCAFFVTVLTYCGLIRNNWELASCLLFFRNFLPTSLGGHYTAHLWSLAIEEHFYLLLPALLLFRGVGRSLRVLVALALLCVAWRTVDLHFHLLSGRLPDILPGARTDLRLDAFLWGCVGAFLIHHDASSSWLKRRYTQPIWVIVLALCLFCIEREPHLVDTWTAILIPLLLIGPLLHPKWVISQFLEFTPLRYIGRVSYSFYLWQQVFLIPRWEPAATPFSYLQVFPRNLLGILVTSLVCFYLVEKPCTQLGRTLARWFAPAALRLPLSGDLRSPLKTTTKTQRAEADHVA
jgi:peptidoglycan/LPS O-acetylase OafA/YrhL